MRELLGACRLRQKRRSRTRTRRQQPKAQAPKAPPLNHACNLIASPTLPTGPPIITINLGRTGRPVGTGSLLETCHTAKAFRRRLSRLISTRRRRTSQRTGRAVTSHLSKYTKPGLALICALVDGEPGHIEAIDAESTRRAGYLESHAKRAYIDWQRHEFRG
jgi:hypothetical protein